VEQVVRRLGAKHGRSEAEVASILSALNEHWITTVEQWQAMSPAQRRRVSLPLVVEQVLDNACMDEEDAGLGATTAEEPCELLCYLYHNRVDGTVFLAAGESIWRQQCSDKVGDLLGRIPQPAALLLADGTRVNEQASLDVALRPGRVLVLGGERHQVVISMHFRGVENWLGSLGLRHLACVLLENHVADFLVIPFIQVSDLEDMGITNPEEQQTIAASVAEMQAGSYANFTGKWLQFVGFASCLSSMSKTYDAQEFTHLKAGNFEALGVPPDEAAFLDSCMQQFSEYTSIEATHAWLTASGFGQYTFQFVRANIPFYALPLVNFFITNEMGVTDIKLWRALRDLKNQPAYRVKAMAYWLRDLDLQQYTLIFAKNLLVNFIEAQTILTDATIAQLIPNERHRSLMKRAVEDIRKLKAYFAITDCFLTPELIERYIDVFATYGKPLTAEPISLEQLQRMGVTDEKDARNILSSLSWVAEQFAPPLHSQVTPLGIHSFSSGARKRTGELSDNLFEITAMPAAPEPTPAAPEPAVQHSYLGEPLGLGGQPYGSLSTGSLSTGWSLDGSDAASLQAFPWLRQC